MVLVRVVVGDWMWPAGLWWCDQCNAIWEDEHVESQFVERINTPLDVELD